MICKMSNVKNLEDEDILDHAMKIIHLLTGQNYIVVKKPEENSITLRNEGLILEPVLYSVVHESNKGRNLCYGRMLQLVDLIIQLLAEELSCSSDFIEEAKDEGNNHFCKDQNHFSEHLTNLVMLVNKMTKDKTQTTGKIFNHILEIIYLLIGEDYIIVEKQTGCTTEISIPSVSEKDHRNHKVIKMDSLTQENNSEKIILDLAKKISQMLNKKALTKSEEDAFYLCMKRCLGGYKEVYKDLNLENEQTFSVLENMNLKKHFDAHIGLSFDHVDEGASVNDPAARQNRKNKRKNKPVRIIAQDVTVHKDNCLKSANIYCLETPTLTHDLSAVDKSCAKIDPGTECIFHYPKNRGTFKDKILDREGLIQCEDQEYLSHVSFINFETMSVGSQGRPYVCNLCGKSFSKNSHLSTHHRVHTGAKPYFCVDCGKRFTSSSTLVDHQRIHRGEKPFACSDCGKCFTKNSNLIDHQRTHTGEKPFECLQCGKRFARSSNLAEHYKIHTGEKSFICSVCGKGFSRSSSLAEHHKIHTGGESFICSECGQCFTKNSSLVRHQSIHTGNKPFVCSDCGKGFSNSSNLARHHITHTGERPYICPICGRSFNQNSNLVSHQKTHKSETFE